MIKVTEHGDVREFVLSTRFSRAMGYQVSVFSIQGTLIDCGFPRVAPAVATILDSGAITQAILTHWHEDHAGNVGLLAKRQIPTMIGTETLARIPEGTRLPLYRWLTWGSMTSVELPPLCGSERLEVIPTPGHTSDHVAVFDPNSATVFGGDLFLGVKASNAHEDENPYHTLASVRRIRDLAPVRYFDSHRGLVLDPMVALSAKADWLASAIGQIEVGLDQGEPDAAIRERVLGPEALVARVSFGQMSKLNFIRAVRRLRHRLVA